MDTAQRATYDDVMTRHGRPGFQRRFATGPVGPMRCRPSNAELRGEQDRRAPVFNDGRVIFDTETAARAAIAELVAEGAPPQETYRCPRSSRGHWHIRRAPHPTTTDQDGDPPR